MIYIVIPCYNVEQYVERCADSLKRQTRGDFHAVLVNDGSKDNTGALCDRIAAGDDRFFVIHKENGGLSDARNVGMDHCFALSADPAKDYIMMLDSDDFLRENCLARMTALCEENDADTVQARFERGSGSAFTVDYRMETPQVFTGSQALLNPAVKTFFLNKFFRMNVFQDERFRKDVLNEDEFIFYRLMWKSRRVVVTPEVLCYYYQHAGSIMSTLKNKLRDNPHRNDWLQAFQERREFFAALGETAQVQRAYERTCIELVLRYAEQMQLPKDQRAREITEGEYLSLYRRYYPKMIGLKGRSLKNKLVYTAFYIWPYSAVVAGRFLPLRK